jgi:hypothetical protein
VRGGGERDVAAEAWWHLHPSWTPSIRDRAVDLVSRDARRLGFATTAADLGVVGPADPSGLSGYAPEYGRIESSYTLRARTRARAPFAIATFITAAARPLEPLTLDVVPADTSPGDRWTTCVARVRAPQMSLTALIAAPADETVWADASPDVLWGGARIRTDARVAVVRTAPGAAPVASLVNGSRVEIAGVAVRLALASAVPAFHGDLRPAVASAVHEMRSQPRVLPRALDQRSWVPTTERPEGKPE